MYTILVVDDEDIERRGIKSLIKKFQLDFKIFEARNGEEALEVINHVNVDILFTDIKMPFMDGIELTRLALKVKPDLKIIFYSAYSDFEYALQAIDLNVIKYILKPIEIEQFLDIMQEVIYLCDKDEQLKQTARFSLQYEKEKLLLDSVRGILIEDDDNIEQKIKRLQINTLSHVYGLLLMDFENSFFDMNSDIERNLNQIFEDDFEYLDLNELQSIVFVKLSLDSQYTEYLQQISDRVQEYITNQYHRDDCFIVISDAINDIKDVKAEFDSMEKRLEDRFFMCNDNILVSKQNLAYDIDNFAESIQKIVEEVNKYIEIRDYFSAKKAIVAFFDGLNDSRQNISIMYLKYNCIEIVKNVYSSCSVSMSNDFQAKLEDVFNTQSLLELKYLLIEMIENEEDKRSEQMQKSSVKAIEDVITIIQSEYMKDLSLQSLAERVYLSPSYISHLFKKETEQSIVQYITTYRLQKATEMLNNTNMKIASIAQKVGYSNFSYFGTVFKNHYGITPARYRERRDA